MNESLYLYATIVCVFGAIALFAWIVQERRKRRLARGENLPVPETTTSTLVDADAKPPKPKPCDVCEDVAPAEVGMPRIVNSGLDLDKTGVRKLHGQTPGYKVVYDESRGPRLCMAHGRMLQRMKEEHLAEQRAVLAKANSQVELSIANYEGGVALALARSEWRKANDSFQNIIEDRSAPQLPALPSAHVVSVPSEPGSET